MCRYIHGCTQLHREYNRLVCPQEKKKKLNILGFLSENHLTCSESHQLLLQTNQKSLIPHVPSCGCPKAVPMSSFSRRNYFPPVTADKDCGLISLPQRYLSCISMTCLPQKEEQISPGHQADAVWVPSSLQGGTSSGGGRLRRRLSQPPAHDRVVSPASWVATVVHGMTGEPLKVFKPFWSLAASCLHTPISSGCCGLSVRAHVPAFRSDLRFSKPVPSSVTSC